MNNPIRKIYDWTLSLSKKKSASKWLGAISFAEASFFPIPPLTYYSFPYVWEPFVKPFFLPQFAQLLRYSEDSRDMQLGILHGMVYRITFISMFLDSLRKNLPELQNGMQNGDGHWSFWLDFPRFLTKFSPLQAECSVWPFCLSPWHLPSVDPPVFSW